MLTSISTLSEGGTLGVFLYDVVTEADAAGNPVTRDNFEWYFSLSFEEVSEAVTVQPETFWMPNYLVPQIQQDQRSGNQSCFG